MIIMLQKLLLLVFVMQCTIVNVHASFLLIRQRYLSELKKDSILAENGNVSKMLRCGIAYCRLKKYQTARMFFEKAVRQKSDSAYCYLAELDYFGVGIETPNYNKAYNLIKKAKQSGVPLADFLLGVMYYDGIVVRRNYKKAFEKFNAVSEKSIYAKLAKYYLFKCYEYGRGTLVNHVLANKLLKEAEYQDFLLHGPRHEEEKKAGRLLNLLLDVDS